jgi:hypothetical protein
MAPDPSAAPFLPADALANPIYAPLREWLEALPAQRAPSLDELNHLAGADHRNAQGRQLRCVAPSAPRRSALQYEQAVYYDGAIATRSGNVHDLFNWLSWLAYPRTKARINAEHLLCAMGDGKTERGVARDVLTLFDEGGGALVASDPSLFEPLIACEWKTLFWTRRADVQQHARLFVLGHAVLEKALAPYRGLTAKVLCLEAPASLWQRPMAEQRAWVDDELSRRINQPDVLASTKSLSPFPLLGMPAYFPAGDHESFYDDHAYFRPRSGFERTRPRGA